MESVAACSSRHKEFVSPCDALRLFASMVLVHCIAWGLTDDKTDKSLYPSSWVGLVDHLVLRCMEHCLP